MSPRPQLFGRCRETSRNQVSHSACLDIGRQHFVVLANIERDPRIRNAWRLCRRARTRGVSRNDSSLQESSQSNFGLLPGGRARILDFDDSLVVPVLSITGFGRGLLTDRQLQGVRHVLDGNPFCCQLNS